jgi:hypothetical protein
MTLVLAIVAVIVGISFPAVSAGLETIRLSSATDSLAAFINAALNRAERRQEAIEIEVLKTANAVSLRSIDGRVIRRLDFPSGVTIRSMQPDTPRILVLPGSAPPRLTIELVNRRGERRSVRVDPVTGTPEILRAGQ